MISWAHGIVISYQLRMRKALGLNPSASTCLVSGGRCISVHWDLFQVVAGASCCSFSSESKQAFLSPAFRGAVAAGDCPGGVPALQACSSPPSFRVARSRASSRLTCVDHGRTA